MSGPKIIPVRSTSSGGITHSWIERPPGVLPTSHCGNSFLRRRDSCSQACTPNYLWDSPTADHSLPEAGSFQTTSNSLPSRWRAAVLKAHIRHLSTCFWTRACRTSEATHHSFPLSGGTPFLAWGAPVWGGMCQGDDGGGNCFLQKDFFTVLQLYSPNLCIASLWVKSSTCFRNLYLDLLSLFGI